MDRLNVQQGFGKKPPLAKPCEANVIPSDPGNQPATPPTATAGTIRRINRNEQIAADKPIQQLLDFGRRSGGTRCDMWGYFNNRGQLELAAVLVPQQGGTGLLFATTPMRRSHLSHTVQLLETICRNTPTDLVALAQGLVAPTDDLLLTAFEQASFRPIATLCYLQKHLSRKVAEPHAPDTPPPGVCFETYTPQLREQFAVVLEASYRQTQDCPALQGLRNIDDVIAGHMATGQFDPSLWTLMRVERQAAGVLLLNPIPEAGCVELVYLGLSPQYRRRKLGSLLMQRGMWQCAKRGESYLTLAVDESNEPAVKLYRQFGFHRTMRKVAMLKILSEKTAPDEQ